jgi:predicted GNAT family N-acyltransferase
MSKLNIHLITTLSDRTTAHVIRHQVFVVGQNVPQDIERDEHDDNPTTHHYLASMENQPVGTIRVVFREDSSAKIGRLAVLESGRGAGVGKLLMQTVLQNLIAENVPTAVLSAQAYLQKFYEDLGFHVVGDRYEEAGIEHVWMEKNLAVQQEQAA